MKILITWRYPWRRRWAKVRRIGAPVCSLYIQVFRLEIVLWYRSAPKQWARKYPGVPYGYEEGMD